MSFMLILEADSRLSEADVRAALSSCGVDELVEHGNGFEGNFAFSNMFFSYGRVEDRERDIRAEHMGGLNWEVGCRVVFAYVTAHSSDCSLQLNRFLETVCKLSDSNWVLSFQYEVIYAIRDERGVQRLKDF